MKVTATLPSPKDEYPYLAVFTGDGKVPEYGIKTNEIVIINRVTDEMADGVNDPQEIIFVIVLFGNEAPQSTNHEDDYYRLPQGFTIEITQ